MPKIKIVFIYHPHHLVNISITRSPLLPISEPILLLLVILIALTLTGLLFQVPVYTPNLYAILSLTRTLADNLISPTHIHGNILDLILTDTPERVEANIPYKLHLTISQPGVTNENSLLTTTNVQHSETH